MLNTFGNAMVKRVIQRILIFLMAAAFFMMPLSEAFADAFFNRSYVTLNTTGDTTVDTMTVKIGKGSSNDPKSVTVKSLYNLSKRKANPTSYSSDTTYCCAALVHRFYQDALGVTISNLNSVTSTPKANKGKISKQTKPMIGDIIRFNDSVHWGIVKSVNNSGNIRIFQQNAWDLNYTKALIAWTSTNRNITLFRWASDSWTTMTDKVTLNKEMKAVKTDEKIFYVYNWPVSTSIIQRALKDGETLKIKRSLKNTYGSLWYELDGGGYVVGSNVQDPQIPLKVTGFLDAQDAESTEGYGTFDVLIDGELVADDVSAFDSFAPEGSAYELTDIKAETGKAFRAGRSCALSGTVKAPETTLLLCFDTQGVMTDLPGDLTIVEEESYMGTALQEVTIPDGCTSIGANAFAECSDLLAVYIPASVTSIADSAFADCPRLNLYVTADSAALIFAQQNSIAYEIVD